jgi:hypothetical protein
MYADPSRHDDLLTIPEAAQRLHVPRHTLFDWFGNTAFVTVQRPDGTTVFCLRESLLDRLATLRRAGIVITRAVACRAQDASC